MINKYWDLSAFDYTQPSLNGKIPLYGVIIDPPIPVIE